MRVVGKAVEERAGTARDRFGHVSRNNHGPERRVTARDTFAHKNHVRHHAPMLHRKRLAGAAHARHDLVRDEKNLVAAADFGQSLDVAFGRDNGAQSRSGDRLEDERGDIVVAVASQEALEIVGAIDIAFGKVQIERAAIAEARRDVAPFGKQRSEGLAAADVAGYGERAERCAMIALAPRDYARTFFVAALEPILTRELDRGFGGLGSAGGEVDAAVSPHPVRSERENALSELFDDGDVELGRVDIRQARSLLSHGPRYFLDAVADCYDRRAPRGVEITPAIRRIDETAFSAACLRIGL